jgi:hypothetical protein
MKNGTIRIQAGLGFAWPLMLAVLAGLSVTSAAEVAPADASQRTPLMNRDKEIALALSACPAFVASKAGVYVLEESGYVKVRESQNGFTAIVQHSLPTSQEPRCMDAEGTRTHLPRILKTAELRAHGKTPEEVKTYVADAFAKGIFQPPGRPGIDYMLSSEILTPNEKGIPVPFPPHVMFYAPYLTNADIGSDGDPRGRVFIVGEGTPHALIIVPVGPHGGVAHVPTGERAIGPQ